MIWVIRHELKYWSGLKELLWTYAPTLAKQFETREEAEQESLSWPKGTDASLGAYVQEMPQGVRP